KLERRAGDEKALGPGEALEPDAERLAHPAAATVGADEPLGFEFLRSVDDRRHATVVLFNIGDGRTELESRVRQSGEARGEHLVQLELLALHAVGMLRGIGD